mmetsp:Transcript_16500/g.40851  ORF Transcript_16500/g.40851 Transcript_16500/m.40851 type:complete len:248 (-) Transcript_16500:1452-2195(-)
MLQTRTSKSFNGYSFGGSVRISIEDDCALLRKAPSAPPRFFLFMSSAFCISAESTSSFCFRVFSPAQPTFGKSSSFGTTPVWRSFSMFSVCRSSLSFISFRSCSITMSGMNMFFFAAPARFAPCLFVPLPLPPCFRAAADAPWRPFLRSSSYCSSASNSSFNLDSSLRRFSSSVCDAPCRSSSRRGRSKRSSRSTFTPVASSFNTARLISLHLSTSAFLASFSSLYFSVLVKYLRVGGSRSSSLYAS